MNEQNEKHNEMIYEHHPNGHLKMVREHKPSTSYLCNNQDVNEY